MYCFYAWFKKGGFETIKLFSYNSLRRCFKAHTILTSIRICLCVEGCGGDAFPHIGKKIPVKRVLLRAGLLRMGPHDAEKVQKK